MRLTFKLAFQVAKNFTVVKNLPANAQDARDMGSIPGSGRFPQIENGNPFQYSCLQNSMGQEGLRSTVYEVAKSWTQLSD